MGFRSLPSVSANCDARPQTGAPSGSARRSPRPASPATRARRGWSSSTALGTSSHIPAARFTAPTSRIRLLALAPSSQLGRSSPSLSTASQPTALLPSAGTRFNSGALACPTPCRRPRRRPCGPSLPPLASSTPGTATLGEAGPGSTPPSREGLPEAQRWLTASSVGHLLLREWPRVGLALAGLLGGTACMVAAPLVGASVVQSAIAQSAPGSGAAGARMLSLLACLYVLEPGFTQLYVRNMSWLAEDLVAQARVRAFELLLGRPMAFFDSYKPAALSAQVGADLDTLRDLLKDNLPRMRGLRAALETIVIVVVLFLTAPRLAPILAPVIAVASAGAALYSRRVSGPRFDADSSARADLVAVMAQAFGAIRTVRSFNAERREQARFQSIVDRCAGIGRSIGQLNANLEGMNRAAIFVALFTLYSYGGQLCRMGEVSPAALLAAIGYCFGLTFAVQGVVQTLLDATKAAAAIRRIRALVAPQPADFPGSPSSGGQQRRAGSPSPAGAAAVQCSEASVRDLAARGDLRLEGVSFAYPLAPHMPVLDRLSLTIPHGQTTALVGRSGAGKTTLVQLLSRFYAPQEGGIWLGGRAVEGMGRGEWAAAVALVSQEPVLFAGSIADNIAYSRPIPTSVAGDSAEEREREEAKIRRAARLANADEFVGKLEGGYGAMVGAGGVQLSGGQRQRLAIARAIYKDSPILILDEATSALDSVSEGLVQQAVERLMHGRTTIVIAHRLSTVQAADNIVVMDGGRAVEQGTHGELLARGGMYSNLVNAQRFVFSE